MRKIYVDSEYKCHAAEAEGLLPLETDFFDGRCDAFLEGYRLIPEGKTWTGRDGRVYPGGMTAPWRDLAVLEAAQAEFEKARGELADMAAALETIYQGVTQ